MASVIALRSFALQPVRSAVLACGFGAGIAAMAGLLGIGQVILEQSRSPLLAGGGDLVIEGAAGSVTNTRFLTSAVLESSQLAGRALVAAPSITDALYLVEDGQPPLRIFVRGGIPSLERGLGDYETSEQAAWQDTEADRRWSSPDPADVLRALDRFHAVPARAERDDSWAEWLYFNGQSEQARFYLTFLVGPRAESGRQVAGVRLQLERDGRTEVFFDGGEVDPQDLLERGPDLRVGASAVELVGLEYRIRLNLWREPDADRPSDVRPDLTGELVLQAVPGRSIPPFRVHGRGGWVSGYVVPVLSGPLGGELEIGNTRLSFAGASGYHDHNWGFWRDVSWRWGQVAGDELSFVYGRLLPPPGVVDPDRLPGLLVALDSDGLVAFTTDVGIEEIDDPASGAPRTISVRGKGESVDLTLRLVPGSPLRTRTPGAGAGELLQMRADYHVAGSVRGAAVEFTATGSAETFRGARGP